MLNDSGNSTIRRGGALSKDIRLLSLQNMRLFLCCYSILSFDIDLCNIDSDCHILENLSFQRQLSFTKAKDDLEIELDLSEKVIDLLEFSFVESFIAFILFFLLL